MVTALLSRHSLKTRITLSTLAIFVIGIWTLAFYANRMLHQDMQRLLGEQQFSMATFMAGEINQGMEDRLRALEQTANQVSPAIMGRTAELQKFLENSPALLSLFNGGISALDLAGTVTADAPHTAGRIGVNYMGVDGATEYALKQGKARIGKPVMGKMLKAPIFVMVVPVRDPQGKVIGALAGVTNLGKPNFLEHVTQGYQGSTGGYHVLVAPQYRLVVTSSDKARIMEELPAPGVNPLIDRFTQGFEGTDTAINPLGVEVMASAKGVPSAGWYVAVALPTADVYSPIHDMQQRMLLATLLLTLLAGGLTWWMLRRQLAPMLSAVTALAAFKDTHQHPQPLPISRQDEIGELIGGFNRLLEILMQREVELKHSETTLKQQNALLTTLLDNLPVGVFMVEAPSAKPLLANKAALNLLGWKNLPDLGKHDLAEVYKAYQRDSGAIYPLERIPIFRGMRGVSSHVDDMLVVRPDGTRILLEVFGSPVMDEQGRIWASLVSFIDITERKHAERIVEQYRSVVQASLDGFWITDTAGRILDANDSICRILGYSREELLGLRIADIEADETAEEIAAHTRAMVEIGHVQFEARHRRKDGSIINVEVSVLSVAEFDENLFAFVRDVTARKQAEIALRESELFLRESQSAANMGSYVLDIASGLWKSSDVFDKLFGIDAVYERSVENWSALVHPDDRAMMLDYFRSEVLGQRRAFDKDYRIIRRDDHVERWVHGLGKLEFDDQGHPLKMYGTIQDITERKQAEEQIRTLAYFDALTSLPNRRLLMDRLGQARIASKRTQEFGALMFLDLDNFKVLNDTQGHDVGDRLLIEVAQRIVANMRQEDTVSRLGGDEYVMMVERLGPDETSAASQAEMIAEKVRTALNQPYLLSRDGRSHYSTPSIGVTLFRGLEPSIDVLLKQADMALYQAKGAGRNTIRFFNPAMQAAIESRSTMENALRQGLAQRQFHLFYQPQINQEGRITGAEALLRWFQDGQAHVSPAQFIPLAEDTGLIIPIGNWVMQTACNQLKAWSLEPHTSQLQIAINVSARQFHQADFVGQVFDALRLSGANPALLKLELTESVVLDNVEEVIARMLQIKALGVTFSLDDFGTGFSSLSYLKRLPLDQIKIDQSFVRDVTSDPNDAAIVRAIIAMGQSLGIHVIAEGVETEAQQHFLDKSGCKHYQGYLFGKPMPIEEWSRIL